MRRDTRLSISEKAVGRIAGKLEGKLAQEEQRSFSREDFAPVLEEMRYLNNGVSKLINMLNDPTNDNARGIVWESQEMYDLVKNLEDLDNRLQNY